MRQSNKVRRCGVACSLVDGCRMLDVKRREHDNVASQLNLNLSSYSIQTCLQACFQTIPKTKPHACALAFTYSSVATVLGN